MVVPETLVTENTSVFNCASAHNGYQHICCYKPPRLLAKNETYVKVQRVQSPQHMLYRSRSYPS